MVIQGTWELQCRKLEKCLLDLYAVFRGQEIGLVEGSDNQYSGMNFNLELPDSFSSLSAA